MTLGRDDYTRLVEPYRAELHAHCYRMLGSVADAEDALQEALVSAWRGLPDFEERSSMRTWLYRIATNACLKLLRRRPSRVLPVDYRPAGDPHDPLGPPLAESIWIEPYPTVDNGYEAREDIELAFVAALQHLPPAQRAVLILRDVLGYSGAETASMLSTTATAVYSSLQRAHRTVHSKLPPLSQQTALQALGDDALSGLVEKYVSAWERGDVDAIVSMLTSDAVLSMPPFALWIRGADCVGEFLSLSPLSGRSRWRLVPSRANGQLAFCSYVWDDQADAYVGHGLNVATLRGDRIAEIQAFLNTDSFAGLGAPDHL